MANNYDWLIKKTPRSVDQLRLWPQNPRLNPDETHIFLSDFAEDLTNDEAEKIHFFDLVKSIVEDGFIPADPIVIWKDDNGKFYVAEGNRRILALKLLRDPNKAPRSIRAFIKSQSQKIDKKSIEKVLVNVAPTFEDAEWYINQRNNTSSLQRAWSRIQQQRWLSELYQKYNDDIDKIMSITKMTRGELESTIRILKIKDLVKEPAIRNSLSEAEFTAASSHKFPISILERFFSNKDVKEKWGIEFDGISILLKNKEGFFNAYSELIRNIVSEDPKRIKIDTRTVTTDLNKILDKLPSIDLTIQDSFNSDGTQHNEKEEGKKDDEKDDEKDEKNTETPKYKKNDPNRNRLILPIYHIKTDSQRLSDLFGELKKLPVVYKNAVAASIRIFLDLSVFNYIETESLSSDICKIYKCGFTDVNLKNRLEYLKTSKLQEQQKKIVSRLVEPKNEFSLDVLNGFVHSDSSPYITSSFLNRFWDFLFPLFQALLDIREEK